MTQDLALIEGEPEAEASEPELPADPRERLKVMGWTLVSEPATKDGLADSEPVEIPARAEKRFPVGRVTQSGRDLFHLAKACESFDAQVEGRNSKMGRYGWAVRSRSRNWALGRQRDKIDAYEVLGLTRPATQEQIRKAYLRRAKALHPDVNNETDTSDELQLVNRAYRMLSKPQTKHLYDTGKLSLDPKARPRRTPHA